VIGLLVNPKNPASESETSDTQAAAQTLGLKLIVQNASSSHDIDAAFASFVQQRVDALTFAADAVLNNCRDQLVALAARHAVAEGKKRPMAETFKGHDISAGIIYQDANIKVTAVENTHFRHAHCQGPERILTVLNGRDLKINRFALHRRPLCQR
jgi:hypothetical protein